MTYRTRGLPMRIPLALGATALLFISSLAPAAIATNPPPPPPGSKFPFTITESGLPTSFPWYLQVTAVGAGKATPVRVNGTTYAEQLTPGVYEVLIFPVGQWEPNPNTDTLTMHTAPAWFNTTFTRNITIPPDENNTTTSGGPFQVTPTLVAFLGITGGVALVAALLVYRMRRGPRTAKPVETESKPRTKRGKAEEGKDDDPDAAERRRARRERREGIRRDRSPSKGSEGGTKNGSPVDSTDDQS